MGIDYLALIRSALKNKGAIEEHKDADYYHLMIRKSYNMEHSKALLPYITYDHKDEYYRHMLIKRPYKLWERTKLLIMLTTAILKVGKTHE